MNFYNLETRVNTYNKLPDQEKLGSNYKKIKTLINSYRKKLAIVDNKLQEPDKYIKCKLEITDKEFAENIIKINSITTIIQDSIDTTTDMDKLINLYLELYQLSQECKHYLQSKQMSVEHVDK